MELSTLKTTFAALTVTLFFFTILSAVIPKTSLKANIESYIVSQQHNTAPSFNWRMPAVIANK